MDSITATLILKAVAQTLSSLNWNVVAEAVSHVARRTEKTDLVVVSPDGRTYIIEARLGDVETHFAELAQAEKRAEELGRSEGRSEVVPVVVTDAPVSMPVSEMAVDVGVTVVSSSGTADEIAQSVVSLLTAPGEARG